ncbi:MAG: hypothetical protein IJ849_01085 [Selenomonadaceae bacterium]|nr:hypothetical protein [Selenomonadaceae bacterium]
MNALQQEAVVIINKLSDDDLGSFMPLLRNLDKKRRDKVREEFSQGLDKAQAWAASVGYKESDITEAIRAVRSRKKHESCTGY